ncbi:MAG: glycosyltransferase family 92 protein [Bacteroidales bacterium]|nr:glycosyltransferase family 92 protein [Bacteroidales bacterium]
MRKELLEDNYFIFDRSVEISWKYYVKSIFYFFNSLWYKLLMNLKKPEIKTKKYKVAICAIFKNEALYLREWIEYHKIVGVEHFYLYNNNSEDNYEEVLKPYIANGSVTLTQWPQNQAQMKCYHNAIERFFSETEWLTFIDIDEFIVPNSTDNIYDFLKPFQKNRPVVIAYWRMFGTSGMISRDPKNLVSEDLTVCWNKYVNIGKVFFNTAYDFNKKDKHNNILHHLSWAVLNKTALPPVNIFDKVCTFGKNRVASNTDAQYFPLQINHYFTKTYDEYLQKKAKGDVYFKINPHDESYFYRHEMKNQSVDYHIFKYLIKLKLALGISK